MARPGQDEADKQQARITALRRAVIHAERTLARETKKRETPCQCQDEEYIYTQAEFEEMREIFETARADWLARHQTKRKPV